jgi:hypothetical protein
MKRLSLIVVALIACVAVGSVAVVTAKPSHTKKVKSKISLKYKQSGDPPYSESATFKGKVKGKKGGRKVCKKHRKVKVRPGIGKVKTNKKGKYSISLNAKPPSGSYTAKVKKKKVHKHHKKIVCKKKTSKPVTVG